MLRTIILLMLAVLLAGCNVVFIPIPIDGLKVPDRLPTPAPTAAAAAPSNGSMVDLSGIPYTVQAHNTVSVVQVRSEGSSWDGTLSLDGELRNDGSEEVPYNIITLRVYDAAGALLDVGSGGAMEIAPGETIAFTFAAQSLRTSYYDATKPRELIRGEMDGILYEKAMDGTPVTDEVTIAYLTEKYKPIEYTAEEIAEMERVNAMYDESEGW